MAGERYSLTDRTVRRIFSRRKTVFLIPRVCVFRIGVEPITKSKEPIRREVDVALRNYRL
jgi:hypothetical protein